MLETAFLAGAGAATLSRLIFKEEGPDHIFARFRQWVAIKARDFEATHSEDKKAIDRFHQLVDLVECPYCLSVWFGVTLALIGGLASGLSPVMLLLTLLAAPSIAWAIGALGLW